MAGQCCEHCSISGEDHDLLIQINTRLERFAIDLQALTSQVVKDKMDKVEAYRMREEADKVHDDHESRLRRVERWGFLAAGGLFIANILLGIAIKYFLG